MYEIELKTKINEVIWTLLNMDKNISYGLCGSPNYYYQGTGGNAETYVDPSIIAKRIRADRLLIRNVTIDENGYIEIAYKGFLK